MTMRLDHTALLLSSTLGLAACTASGPEGLLRAPPASTTVKFDFFHLPLPEIPLPNDLAVRFDDASATQRRLNISEEAPTEMERRVRRLANTLDGWGVLQPISIPFTGDLDITQILAAHGQDDFDTSDDLVYLINVDPRSPNLGKLHHLDIGKNTSPGVLENLNGYGRNDPRGFTISLLFEEADEDLNRNGALDVGEDTDMDGVLDRPNYKPGLAPAADDLAGRADALMTFYEAETHTLIARPLEPLDERTRYAVVVTRRLRDARGAAVGSPFEWVNHLAQTDELALLPEVLPAGLTLDDVAFAFCYTTQTVEQEWLALRDGLYGHGVQADLATAFPAEVDALSIARDRDRFPNLENPYIVHSETVQPIIEQVLKQFRGFRDDSRSYASITDAQKFVDYYVVGSYTSPQLWVEDDGRGNPLGYFERHWPADLHSKPAAARGEKVLFTLVVPRKEVSARGQGKPADLVILSHGYGGNRFDAINLGPYFAKAGLAVLSIDGPSHGLSISPTQRELVRGIFEQYGVAPFGDALVTDRASDRNGDGTPDSGADFWSAYLFHTRDIVRQFALDYLQLVRIVRGFDGEKRWGIDVNGDGQPELAGDFDGDGVVDVGGPGKVTFMGGSLGGIMSVVMSAVEPSVGTTVPIAAGGTLSTIGLRSTVGGVRVAMVLRAMGPMYLGDLDDSGALTLKTLVPDLNRAAVELPIARVQGVSAGDVLVAENLSNGSVRCGLISADGTVRVGLPSDEGDATRLRVYGPGLVTGGDHCEVAADARAKAEVTAFAEDFTFQTRETKAGAPLVAMAQGLGSRRGHPEVRRLQGIAQLVLDRADPAALAPHIQRRPLTFPGTGEKTGAHMLLMTTMGDSSVPDDSGMAIARAAGLLPYLEKDPRYGKPAHQVLLDWHVAESSDTYPRFRDSRGRSVHGDVEGFDQRTAPWSSETPYLDPPMRLGMDRDDALGGRSAAIFPLAEPNGSHGFGNPYEVVDDVIRACRQACPEGMTCSCTGEGVFDPGNYLVNMITRYLKSGGKSISTDLCMSQDTCADEPTPPPARPASALK